MKTSRDIKSAHTAGMRCIPKVHRPVYLDLYMLKREKDQLFKEITALDKRKASAAKALADITKRMDALQKEAQEEQKKMDNSQISSKPVKTISINY